MSGHKIVNTHRSYESVTVNKGVFSECLNKGNNSQRKAAEEEAYIRCILFAFQKQEFFAEKGEEWTDIVICWLEALETMLPHEEVLLNNKDYKKINNECQD